MYERSAKESLFSSLYRLLQIKRIDVISVEEVVGGAKVARSTFYRNFHDKYELLQWSYERLLVMTFSTTTEPLSVRQTCIKTFEMYQRHRLFFRNGLDSEDPNALHRSIFEVNCEYWRHVLQMAGFDPDADANMRVVGVFIEGAIARLEEWVRTGMREAPEDVADEVLAAVPMRFARCLDLESTALERFV